MMEQSASESSDYDSDAVPPVLVQEEEMQMNNNDTDLPQLDADYHNCAKCLKSNNADKKELFSAGGFKKGDNGNTEWIACDDCDKWYHIECVDLEEYQINLIASYYCSTCRPPTGSTKPKPLLLDHRYNFANEEERSELPQVGTKKWIEDFKKYEHIFPKSDELTLYDDGYEFMAKFDKEKEWEKPLLIKKVDGLGLKIPSPDFGMKKIVELVGADEVIDTVDVYVQTNVAMKLGTFAHFWEMPEPRERLFNMLSFEFSHTELMDIISAPTIMYELSWVHKFWPPINVESDRYIVVPDHLQLKPDVAMFCLLGMGGSYTDFHIDFGGSSVWYHVFRGQKVFYIIEPTETNFEHFAEWSTDEKKSEKFLNDLIPSSPMRRVVINAGETLMIPSGWIHAVYTPLDSIVFGGNFIHDLGIKNQLRVYDIETRCSYDDHFLFPSFELTNWYAAKNAVDRYYYDQISPGVVEGLKVLLTYLNKWVARDKQKDPKYQMHNVFRQVQEELKKVLEECVKEQQLDDYDPSNEMKVKSIKFKIPKSIQSDRKRLHHKDKEIPKKKRKSSGPKAPPKKPAKQHISTKMRIMKNLKGLKNRK